MKLWSSGWIDTSTYKTKEVLFKVVGDRVRYLEPANKAKTYYKALCPFHHEKTPSFHLHDNKGESHWVYKCLGCGKSGDVFRFLMEYEHWEFWEALAYLKKLPFSKGMLQLRKISPKQMRIPFPLDENFEFIWISPDMGQLGYT